MTLINLNSRALLIAEQHKRMKLSARLAGFTGGACYIVAMKFDQQNLLATQCVNPTQMTTSICDFEVSVGLTNAKGKNMDFLLSLKLL